MNTNTPNQDISTRFIQVSDEDGSIFLANTNMTSTEIIEAMSDDTLDENEDYEERVIEHAKKLGKTFERVYIDEEIFF